MKLFMTPEDIAKKEREANSLVECKVCRRQLSPRATRCPECGEPQYDQGKRMVILFLAIVLIVLLFTAIAALNRP